MDEGDPPVLPQSTLFACLAWSNKVFGFEVYDVKYNGIGEAIKMIKAPEEVTFELIVCDFSTICNRNLFRDIQRRKT